MTLNAKAAQEPRYYFLRTPRSWGLNRYPGNWNIASQSRTGVWTDTAVSESQIPSRWPAHRVPDTFVVLFGPTFDKVPV